MSYCERGAMRFPKLSETVAIVSLNDEDGGD
jgi:hypothetical protein